MHDIENEHVCLGCWFTCRSPLKMWNAKGGSELVAMTVAPSFRDKFNHARRHKTPVLADHRFFLACNCKFVHNSGLLYQK